MIQYRYLGRSALKVSPLAVGTQMFGGSADEMTASRIIAKASDRGINFIDTADTYNDGKSEEIVGRSIKARRDWWVLATKFFNSRSTGPNDGGFSRKWVMQSVEASLRRLGTDYVDILYFHKTVLDAPLGEPLRAVADLIRHGKVRYFGVSNFRGWRIAEIAHLADQLGIDRPIVSQPVYNIVNRSAEAEQLPAANFYGLGVVPYSPLARGILSGKYRADHAPPPDSRIARGDKRILDTEWRPESLEVARQVTARAEARGMTAAEFAVAWVLNNKFVTAVLAGPRTEAQWDVYAKSLDAKLSAEDETFVNGLVTTGHPSTLGYNDPNLPMEGRFPR
ncbi:aldo/keto reductase [soil metagenome]